MCKLFLCSLYFVQTALGAEPSASFSLSKLYSGADYASSSNNIFELATSYTICLHLVHDQMNAESKNVILGNREELTGLSLEITNETGIVFVSGNSQLVSNYHPVAGEPLKLVVVYDHGASQGSIYINDEKYVENSMDTLLTSLSEFFTIGAWYDSNSSIYKFHHIGEISQLQIYHGVAVTPENWDGSEQSLGGSLSCILSSADGSGINNAQSILFEPELPISYSQRAIDLSGPINIKPGDTFEATFIPPDGFVIDTIDLLPTTLDVQVSGSNIIYSWSGNSLGETFFEMQITSMEGLIVNYTMELQPPDHLLSLYLARPDSNYQLAKTAPDGTLTLNIGGFKASPGQFSSTTSQHDLVLDQLHYQNSVSEHGRTIEAREVTVAANQVLSLKAHQLLKFKPGFKVKKGAMLLASTNLLDIDIVNDSTFLATTTEAGQTATLQFGLTPEFGLVTQLGDTLTYSSNTGYVGFDSFSYRTISGNKIGPEVVVLIDVDRGYVSDAPVVIGPALGNDARPVFSWTPYYSASENETYRVAYDSTNFNGPFGAEISSRIYIPPVDLDDGSHYILVQQKVPGSEYQWSQTGRFDFVIDQTPPELPEVSVAALTGDHKPTWSISGNGASFYLVKLDHPDMSQAEPLYSGAYQPTFPLGHGAHALYVQAIDDLGNISSLVQASTFVDLMPPEFSHVMWQNGYEVPPEGLQVSIAIEDIDAVVDGSSIGLWVNGLSQSVNWNGTHLTTTLTDPSDGLYVIRVDASDMFDNEGRMTLQFEIEDGKIKHSQDDSETLPELLTLDLFHVNSASNTISSNQVYQFELGETLTFTPGLIERQEKNESLITELRPNWLPVNYLFQGVKSIYPELTINIQNELLSLSGNIELFSYYSIKPVSLTFHTNISLVSQRRFAYDLKLMDQSYNYAPGGVSLNFEWDNDTQNNSLHETIERWVLATAADQDVVWSNPVDIPPSATPGTELAIDGVMVRVVQKFDEDESIPAVWTDSILPQTDTYVYRVYTLLSDGVLNDELFLEDEVTVDLNLNSLNLPSGQPAMAVLSLLEYSDNQSLWWSYRDGDTGQSLSSFEPDSLKLIYWPTNSIHETTEIVLDAAATQYQLNGLTLGQEYQLMIQLVDQGRVSLSKSLSFTPSIQSVNGFVSGLKTEKIHYPVGATKGYLEWFFDPGIEVHQDVIGFLVRDISTGFSPKLVAALPVVEGELRYDYHFMARSADIHDAKFELLALKRDQSRSVPVQIDINESHKVLGADVKTITFTSGQTLPESDLIITGSGNGAWFHTLNQQSLPQQYSFDNNRLTQQAELSDSAFFQALIAPYPVYYISLNDVVVTGASNISGVTILEWKLEDGRAGDITLPVKKMHVYSDKIILGAYEAPFVQDGSAHLYEVFEEYGRLKLYIDSEEYPLVASADVNGLSAESGHAFVRLGAQGDSSIQVQIGSAFTHYGEDLGQYPLKVFGNEEWDTKSVSMTTVQPLISKTLTDAGVDVNLSNPPVDLAGFLLHLKQGSETQASVYKLISVLDRDAISLVELLDSASVLNENDYLFVNSQESSWDFSFSAIDAAGNGENNELTFDPYDDPRPNAADSLIPNLGSNEAGSGTGVGFSLTNTKTINLDVQNMLPVWEASSLQVLTSASETLSSLNELNLSSPYKRGDNVPTYQVEENETLQISGGKVLDATLENIVLVETPEGQAAVETVLYINNNDLENLIAPFYADSGLIGYSLNLSINISGLRYDSNYTDISVRFEDDQNGETTIELLRVIPDRAPPLVSLFNLMEDEVLITGGDRLHLHGSLASTDVVKVTIVKENGESFEADLNGQNFETFLDVVRSDRVITLRIEDASGQITEINYDIMVDPSLAPLVTNIQVPIYGGSLNGGEVIDVYGHHFRDGIEVQLGQGLLTNIEVISESHFRGVTPAQNGLGWLSMNLKNTTGSTLLTTVEQAYEIRPTFTCHTLETGEVNVIAGNDLIIYGEAEGFVPTSGTVKVTHDSGNVQSFSITVLDYYLTMSLSSGSKKVEITLQDSEVEVTRIYWVDMVSGSKDPEQLNQTLSLSTTTSDPTNSTSIQFTLSGNDIVEYRYRVDSGPWSTPAPLSDIVLSDLTAGQHQVEVMGRNYLAQWQSPAASWSWTIDTSTPVIEVESFLEGGPIDSNTPAFVIKVDDNQSLDASSISMTLSNGNVLEDIQITDFVFSQGQISWTPSSNLENQNYTLTTQISDQAGSTTTHDFNFLVDTEAPVVNFTNLSEADQITSSRYGALLDTVELGSGLDVEGSKFRLNGALVNVTWIGSSANVQLQAMQDGEQVLSWSVIDQAGLANLGELTFFVDTTPVVMNITNSTNQFVTRRPFLEGEFVDTHDDLILTSLRVSLNGVNRPGAESTYDSQGFSWQPASDLIDGEYALSVIATEASGLMSQVDYHFEIDSSSPRIRFNYFDGQILSSDIPELKFEVLDSLETFDSSSLSLLVDGQVPAGLNTADREMTWQPNGLTEGAHQITYSVSDHLGNLTSGNIQVIYDSEPVIVSWTLPVEGAALNQVRPVINSSISDNTSGVVTSSITFKLNQVVQTGWSYDGGVFTWTPSVDLPQGPYQASILVQDHAGWQTEAILNFNIDATGPVIDFSAPFDLADLQVLRPTVEATIYDTLAGLDPNVTFKVNGATQAATLNNGTLSWVPSSDLPEGSYSFEITASDLLGNESVAAHQVIIDAQVPTIVSLTDALQSGQDTEVRVDIKDNGSGLIPSSVAFTYEAETLTPVLNNGNEFYLALPGRFQEGNHSISVSAGDEYGNQTQSDIDLTLDFTPPSISFVTPAANAFLSANAFNEIVVNVSDLTAGIDASSLVLKLDDVQINGLSITAEGNIEYTLPEAVAEGEHKIEVYIRDLAGLEQVAVNNFVTESTNGPQLSWVQPSEAQVFSEAPNVEVNFNPVTGPIDLNKTEVWLDHAEISADLVADSSLTATGLITTFDSIGGGQHTLKLIVWDTNGGSTTESRTFAYQGQLSVAYSVEPVGAGTVSPLDASNLVEYGSQLQLNAVPTAGYIFDYWEGSLVGSNPSIGVHVYENMNFVAVFKALPQQLVIDSSDAVSLNTNPNTGMIDFLSGRYATTGANVTEKVENFVENYKTELGYNVTGATYSYEDKSDASNDRVIIRQSINGIEVIGAEVLAVLDKANGDLLALSGALQNLDSLTSTECTPEEAGACLTLALQDMGLSAEEVTIQESKHVVFNKMAFSQSSEDDQAEVALLLHLVATSKPIDTIYYVKHDASEILYKIENSFGALAVEGYGSDLNRVFPGSLLVNFDAYPGVQSAFDNFKAYFEQQHAQSHLGQVGEDQLNIVLDYGPANEKRAFYFNNHIVFSPNFYSPELIAHEATHAVVGYRTPLYYAYEAGAINEALSDVFAILIESYNPVDQTFDTSASWEISAGAEILRDLSDPKRLDVTGGQRPAHMSEFKVPEDDSDNGGVHINGSILTLAFYLMANGTDAQGHNGKVVSAMGYEVLGDALYRTLDFLTSTSSFSEFRAAFLMALEEVAPAQVQNAKDAFFAVGLTSGTTTELLYDPDYGLVQTIYIPDLDQNYELPIHLELRNFSVAAGVDYQKTATHSITVANVDVQNSASGNPAGEMHVTAGRAIYLGDGFEVETEASFSATLNSDLALNQAPVVEVGNDLFLPFPSLIPLNGSYTDDGLPTDFDTTIKWKVVQKPAAASIDASFVDDQLNTSVLVSHPGLYKFRLEVSDGSRLSSREFNVFLDNSAPEYQLNSPQGSPLVNSLTDLLEITVSDSDSGLDLSNIELYLGGVKQDGLVFASSDPMSEIQSNGLAEFQASFDENGLLDRSKIAVGIRNSFVIRNDGTLFGWGRNLYGELGLGYMSTNETSPQENKILKNIVAVSAGDKHTLALDKYGRIWAFGSNDQHQLGFDDSVTGTATPKLLDLGVSAKVILARASWSMALDVNGDLWVWGKNGSGQLGVGHRNIVETPQKISGYNFVDLFGSMHNSYASVMAVDAQGQIWAWGSGYHGILTFPLPPIDPGADPFVLTPTLVPSLSGFKAFTLGLYHGVGVDQFGVAKSWGSNTYGQLGRAFTGSDENPVAVENISETPAYFGSAVYSSSYLSENRTIWSWGKATYGNLGRTIAGSYDQVPGQVAINDVVAYAHEYLHAIALDAQGHVWSYGYNSTAQLGDGSTTSRTTPAMIPDFKAYVPVTKTIYSTADIAWQPSTNLDDGLYELSLVVTNNAGVSNAIPITFELDSTPPSVVFSYPTHQQGLNEAQPTMTATISESYSELDLNTLEFQLDGQIINDYTFDGTNFSYQPSVSLADGEHKLVLKIRDTANNLNQQNITFYLDHQAPSISHNFASTHYQNSTTFNFSASINDAIGTITNVEIDWDGVSQTVTGSLENLSWSISDLSEGSTSSFVLRAYDQSNNMTQTSFDVVIESTAPSVSVDTWPSLPELPKYTTTDPVITATLSDDLSGIEVGTIHLLIDGQPTAFSVNDSDLLNVSLSTTLNSLSQGGHRFQLTFSDQAGNARSLNRQFIVDTVGPVVSSVTPASSELINLGYESGAFTINLQYQDSLSGIDLASTTVDVEVAPGTWLTNVPVNKSPTALSVTLNQSQILSEDITFRFILVDQAGNANVVLHPVHFQNLKPEIRNLSPLHYITFYQGNFNIDVIDDPFRTGPELVITWELRSGVEEGKTAADYLNDIHLEDPSYTLGKSGKYVFAVMVSDGTNIAEAVTTVDFYNDVPVVKVGPAQIIELAIDTQLSATLEDEVLPYGGSYEWLWTAHSIPVGADAPSMEQVTSQTPSVGLQNSGRYTFKVTVNDGEFDSVNSDSSYLEVYLHNEVPQVDAGEDQVVGRMYTDLDGTIVDDTHPFGIHAASTTWEMLSGPAPAVFSDDEADVRVFFTEPGDYYFQLTYNDGEFESSDIVKIKVLDYFTIGSSRDIFYRDTLRMFWQHESKPFVYYEWQVIDQPQGSTVLFENSKATKTDVVFDRVGDYVIRMNVTGGHFQSKDIVLTVVNDPPQVNIEDQVVITTLESQLPGNITDDHPDDLVYRWSASRDVLISDPSAPWPRFTFPETGFYEVYLEIDDHDLPTTKKTIVVEVDLVPEIEEVSMLWLGNENYELQATIKDDHPENLTYSWSLDPSYEGSDFNFTGNRDQSREPATVSALGVYPVILIVNDGHTQVSGIYRLQTRVHMEVGSHSQFKTIQQAIDQLPGKLESRAKIVVAPGDYEGFVVNGLSLETSASAPLLITASSPGDSIIKQQAVSNLITITNAPYVTLKGFRIDGTNQTPERPIGVKLWNSDQLTLDTCWIRNFSSNESGVGVAAFNTNSLFKTFFINCQYGSNDKNFIVERR